MESKIMSNEEGYVKLCCHSRKQNVNQVKVVTCEYSTLGPEASVIPSDKGDYKY